MQAGAMGVAELVELLCAIPYAWLVGACGPTLGRVTVPSGQNPLGKGRTEAHRGGAGSVMFHVLSFG